jgi:hypothetical protein
MRQIERPQRVELRAGEAGAKILAGLSHPGADRPMPLHDRECVDRAIGARGMAGRVADRAFQALDGPMLAPLRRWPGIGQTFGRAGRGSSCCHRDLRNNT